MSVLIYEAFQVSVADDVKAATLTGVKIGLTKSVLDIAPSRVLADFDGAKATYTGYAKAAVTWHNVSRADDGSIELVSAPITFRPTDAVAPNSIYAWWLEDAGAAILYAAEAFSPGPLPMNSAMDELVLVIRYRPASGFISVVVS